MVFLMCSVLASSDYENFTPLSRSGPEDTTITFTAWDDDITLEYDDRVFLTYTPESPLLIESTENAGEFIRYNATINIIDTDSKSLKLITTALKCKTLGVVWVSKSDMDALCACSTKLIIGRGPATVVGSGRAGRRRLSKNAAYIRALEPLKPLVSLV